MFCNCFFEKKRRAFFDAWKLQDQKNIERERGKSLFRFTCVWALKNHVSVFENSLCVEILPRAFHPFSSSLLLLLLSDLYYYY